VRLSFERGREGKQRREERTKGKGEHESRGIKSRGKGASGTNQMER